MMRAIGGGGGGGGQEQEETDDFSMRGLEELMDHIKCRNSSVKSKTSRNELKNRHMKAVLAEVNRPSFNGASFDADRVRRVSLDMSEKSTLLAIKIAKQDAVEACRINNNNGIHLYHDATHDASDHSASTAVTSMCNGSDSDENESKCTKDALTKKSSMSRQESIRRQSKFFSFIKRKSSNGR